MTDFTTYSENEVADWMFLGSDAVAPGTIYVALHTGDPSNDASANEVSASDYAREETTAGTDWIKTGTAAPVAVENDARVEFTSDGDWGTISHVSIWDGPGDVDNPLAKYEMDGSVEVLSGDTLRFREGELRFEID